MSQMSNGLEELQDAFKQLRLSEISLELPVLMREAEQQSWTYYELLNHLLQYELTKRDEKNKARRLKFLEKSHPLRQQLKLFSILVKTTCDSLHN